MTTTFDFTDMTQMKSYKWSPTELNTERSFGFTDATETITNGDVSLILQKYKDDSSITVDFDYLDEKDIYIPKGITAFINCIYKVVVPSDYILQSVSFTGIGGLNKVSGEPGTPFTSSQIIGGLLSWTANPDIPVSSISFKAGDASSSEATVMTMTVKYSKPATPLTINSTTPANGVQVQTFNSLTFNFNTIVSKVAKPNGVTLSCPDGSTKTLTIGNSGSYSISASLSGTALGNNGRVGDDGEYTVNVAAGTFQNNDGSVNAAYSSKFKVYAKRDILAYKSYSPTTGAQLDVIKIVYNDQVAVDDSKNPTVKFGGAAKGPMTLSLDPDDITQKTVLLTSSAPFTDLGAYTIDVPAGAIHTSFYGSSTADVNDRWNAAFSLSFTVDRPQSETMLQARAMLKTGIGYPATTTDAYKNLKQAIDTEADDEALQLAMNAYQAETDVTLPATNTYYIIGHGSNFYAYNGEVLSMVTSSGKAYSFLATKSGDTYTLTTTEATTASPKYLAAAALSETASALTLSKGSKLGTLAISGFTGDYTFTVGSKPATPVNPSTTITPDIHLQSKLVQNAGDELILFVEGNFTATLSETAAPYITNSNGQKVSVSGAVLTAKDASTNKFNVTTAGLSAGIYLLHLPKGTFVYKSTGGTVVDTEGSGLQFTIQNGGTSPGPDDDPTPTVTVTPTVKLNKASITKPGVAITVTIGNVDKAVLKSGAKPTLTTSNNVQSSAVLTKAGDVTFTLNTSALAYGTTYTLTLPTNTFTYTKSGATVNDVVLTATFSIDKDNSSEGGGGTTTEQFNTTYSEYYVYRAGYHAGDHLADVDLNELYIYTYVDMPYDGIAANPDKQVQIVSQNSFTKLPKNYVGHFENDPTFAKRTGLEGTQAVKLVMDVPFVAGDLDTYRGIYVYRIPEGAFGDLNYGKYVKNPKSISASQCKVNAANINGIFYTVNNATANREYPSDEVYERAKYVANTVGPGFPSASNSARSALKTLVTNGVGTDADFEAAMEEVYKVSTVESPVSHNFYKVEAVASNGESAWLMYNGTQLLLTKDASKATALRTTIEAGYYSLETGDGKFVATLEQLVPKYTPANCAYTIARLPQIGSASNAQRYGLLSLKGPAGYAVADVSALTFGAPTESANVFTTSKTNGFRMTEVLVGDIVSPDIEVILTPGEGRVSKLNTVTISFKGMTNINATNPNRISLRSSSTVHYPVSVQGVTGAVGQFIVTFSGVEDDTEYDLLIDDGAFTYSFANSTHHIKKITAHYYVHNEPLTNEELQLAKSLLNMKGIGYPQTLSAGRKALQAVVDNPAATNAELDEAVTAFYAETKVTMPTSGKWYKIAAQASDARSAWLQYDGTKIVPTRDYEKAGAFQALDVDGAFNFTTIDGKRLRLMKSKEADGTVATNVTFTYDENLNGLMLEKLPVANTLGLLAISGSVDGKTDAYAQVNVPQSVFTTAVDVAPVYTETLTNAFTFQEVDASHLPVLSVNMDFSPADSTEVESLSQIEVTFSSDDVSLHDQKLLTLTDEGGKSYTIKSVTKKEGTKNVFVAAFDALPLNNTYTLTIAKGAFTFTYGGNTYDVDGSAVNCIVLPQRATNDEVTFAKNLLKYSGLGYPTSKSASRILLKTFTSSGRPTKAEYTSAVSAFYDEKDIEMPVAGRYYTLSACGNNGTQAYLQYDGKELSLTDDLSKATGLEVVVNKDGTYQLILGNGKVVSTLGATSASYSAADAQTISRFPISDVSSESTFGLFSLKTAAGFEGVNLSTLTFEEAAAKATYGAVVTHAFRFAVIAKEHIAAPQPEVTFDPVDGSKLDNLKYVNVSFSDHAPVALLDRELTVLTNGTDSIRPSMVDTYEGKPNYFRFTFNNVPVGYYYTAVFDEGTFGYQFADSVYTMPKLSVGYNVKEPEASAQQKKEAVQLLSKTGLGCPTATSVARQRLAELIEHGGTITEFTIAIDAYKNDGDVEKPVSGQYYLISAVGNSGKAQYLVCKGESVTLSTDANAATPFKMNIHDDGTFSFETTDHLFLKQLKQTSLVSGLTSSYSSAVNDLYVNRLTLEDHSYDETMGYFCISDADGTYALVDVEEGLVMTNPGLELAYFDADWTNAIMFTLTTVETGIRSATVLGNDADAVYDLQGRRVTGMLKKGRLYIRGGKKFVAE